MHGAVLFAAKRVLEAANRVLNLSGNLFAFAFSFELGITGDLADDFLHGTVGLLCRSLDAILVHVRLPFGGNCGERQTKWKSSIKNGKNWIVGDEFHSGKAGDERQRAEL